MKVLIITSVYPRTEKDSEVPWLRSSVAHLVKAGVDVEVLAPAYQGLKSHKIDGITIHRFRYAPAPLEVLTHDEGAANKIAGKPWMQLLAVPYIISGLICCLRLARRKKYNIIHAHWPFPHAFIAYAACKLFRIPLVLNFHGAELLLIRKYKWIKPFMWWIIGAGSALIANSRFTANRIRAIRKRKVHWSPYGTPLSSMKTQILHPVKDRFRILFVGRLIERKGVQYLIQAASKLDPSLMEVRIIGDGDMSHELRAFAQKIAPQTTVFTGKLSQADLQREYEAANIFVLPAIVDRKGDTEGLGVVLIEAMEYGLPVVASNVGGISDVVINRKTGLLVPQKDPEALAAAFEILSRDLKLAHSLIHGAELHIRENFDWDQIISRQITLYRKLLSCDCGSSK